MNGVLLIPCVGPMQSWGTRSRFQERDTEREPSKSGVIGLLCAALGRDREAPIDDLAILRIGVRVDQEGKLDVDFQTAQNVAVASGGPSQDLLSNRHYLSDAVIFGCFGRQLFYACNATSSISSSNVDAFSRTQILCSVQTTLSPKRLDCRCYNRRSPFELATNDFNRRF